MRSRSPVRSEGKSPARKACSRLLSAADKGGPITPFARRMFSLCSMLARGAWREKPIRPTAWWLGRLGRASDAGGTPAVPNRGLSAAAFDRVAFGAPAQHAAGQIGDILEAGLLQDVGGLRRAAAGAAHRDDRPVMAQFGGALGQFA